MEQIQDDAGMTASLDERVVRYNTSLEEFEKAAQSGELTEDKIRSLGLTEPATERLVNTLKNYQPAQEQQVSATAADPQPLVGGSLFEDVEYDYDPEFFNPTSIQSPLPKKEEKKAQVGFATEVVMTGMGEPADGVADLVVEEQYYGDQSQTVKLVADQATPDPKQQFWSSVKDLQFAAENPLEATRQLGSRVTDFKLKTPEQKIVEAAVRNLTPDAKKVAVDFDFISKEWMAKSYLDDVFSAEIGKQVEKLGFWNTVATILNPAQSATSRIDAGKLVSLISEGINLEDKGVVISKANVADDVSNYLLDKSLSSEEFVTRVEALAAFLKENDELAASQFGFTENLNPVWAIEILDIIQSEVRAKGQGKTIGAILDGLDAVDAATWTDSLYRLSRVAVLKAIRPSLAAKAATGWNPQDIEAVNRLLREATGIQGEMPSQQFRFYEVDGPIVDQEVINLQATASSVITRGERKSLEGQKKSLGHEIAKAKAVDAKARAKELQAQGLKFKQAQAVAKKEQADVVAELESKLSGVQAQIDAADKASAARGQLERIRQTSPQRILEPVKPSDGIPRLNQDSLFDALTPINPEKVGEVLQTAKTPEDGARLLGMTTDDLSTRLLGDMNPQPSLHPNHLTGQTSNVPPSKYDLMYQKFTAELNNIKFTDLLTQEEITKAGDVYAEIVKRESNATLFPSGTTKAEATEDGMLNVDVMFGKNRDGGYADVAEAEKAAKYLFGTEYKILDGGQDQVYIQGKTTLNPDRRYADIFAEDIFGPTDVFTTSIQPMSMKMQRELFDIYSNMTDRANRLSVLITEPLKALGKLNTAKSRDHWMKALLQGDNDGVEYGSKQALEAALGHKVSGSVWDAYNATRKYYQAVADVRQRQTYINLSSDGYRGILLRGNPLQDLDGRVYGRPIVERPEIVPNPTSQSDVPSQGVWGENILDLRTGDLNAPLLKLDSNTLDQVYSGGAVFIRMNRAIETGQGDFYHAVVKLDDIRDLPANPMNIRPGHIDRNYAAHGDAIQPVKVGGEVKTKAKGGNQYVVEALESRIVNGVPVRYNRTVAITGTKDEAETLLADIATEIANKENISFEEARSRLNALPSRERKGELGLDEGRTLSNLPSHARHRGDQIKGSGYNGFAEIADPVTALNKSVNEVRGLLGKDVVEVMRSRFAKTYAPYTTSYDGFPTAFDRIAWKRDVDSDIRSEAKKQYDSIVQQDRLINGRKYASMLDGFETMFKVNAEKSPMLYGILHNATKLAGMTLDEATRLTTTMYIALRTNYQVIANSAQMLSMVAQNPVRFTAQTMPRTLAAMMHLAAPSKYSAEVLAKVFGGVSGDFGMTGAEFSRYIKNMKESGVFNIDVADDILHLVSGSAKVEAGLFNLRSRKFWNQVVNPIEWLHTVGRVASVPAKAAITLNNFVAWNHAFTQVAGKKGMEYALSRRGTAETQGLMNRLTFNQNRSDQLAYQQQREAQLMFQFMQHPQKMFLGTYVDPLVRTVSGGKVGVFKEGTNPYADTWAQAFMTTMSMTTLFGVGATASGVILWDEAKDDVSDWAKQNLPQEAVEYFVEGLVGNAFNQMVGERTNISERISAANVLQSTLDMMFTNDNGLVIGGPAMNLVGSFKELGRLGKAYWNVEDLTKEEAIKMLDATAMKAIAGYSDAFKAYYAYKFNSYITKDGVILGDAGPNGWVAQAMSVSPQRVLDYYKVRDEVASAEDNMRQTVNFAIRVSADNLLALGKREEDLRPDDIVNATLVGLRQLEILHHGRPDMIAEAKKQFMQRNLSDPTSMIMRNAERLIRVMPPKEAVRNLERIQQLRPESKDYIQMMIDTLAEKENNDE